VELFNLFHLENRVNEEDAIWENFTNLKIGSHGYEQSLNHPQTKFVSILFTDSPVCLEDPSWKKVSDICNE
jgi:hypothetical protein